VVALSIAYPGDDPPLGYALEKLRRYLRDGVGLLVGGRATDSYRKILDAIGQNASVRPVFAEDLAKYRGPETPASSLQPDWNAGRRYTGLSFNPHQVAVGRFPSRGAGSHRIR